MSQPASSPIDRHQVDALTAAIERMLPAYLADLERLVNIDCGSYTRAGVDEVGAWTAERLRSLGAMITTHANEEDLGDTVVAEIAGDDPDGPALMLIGHLDTV